MNMISAYIVDRIKLWLYELAMISYSNQYLFVTIVKLVVSFGIAHVGFSIDNVFCKAIFPTLRSLHALST